MTVALRMTIKECILSPLRQGSVTGLLKGCKNFSTEGVLRV